MRARVLHSVASLIGELAEVHLPGVARKPQHIYVGARAKNPRLSTGQNHGCHFGVLKSYSLKGIMQFDVDAEVIRIQLELVAWTDTCVFLDVHRKSRHPIFNRQFPMSIAGGRYLEVYEV